MTIKEFYHKIGADYDGVLARFAGSEALLSRFLHKFADDQTYAKLEEAYAAGNYDDILAHAHTLKGVSANLNLDCLTSPAAQIVSKIRAGEQEQIAADYEAVKKAYAVIIEGISQI